MRFVTRCITAFVLSIAATAASADLTIVDQPGMHYAFGTFHAPGNPFALSNYMYCELVQATMYCGAGNNDNGPFVSCATTDPNLKRMLPMVDKSSMVEFFWDDAGTCSRMIVANNTANLEVVPPAGAFKLTFPVFIDTVNRTAHGSLSATPTPNTNEGVHCTVTSFGRVECGAVDSTGNGVFCDSTADSASQTLADQTLAVSAINESSFVIFNWDTTTALNRCTQITVVNASYIFP